MIGPGSFDRRAGTLGRRSRNRARTIRPFAANLLARLRAAWVGDLGAAVLCARLVGAVYRRRAGVENYARKQKKESPADCPAGRRKTWSGTPGSNLNAIRVAAADLAAFVAAQRSRYEGLRPSVAHSSVPESRDM